MTMACGGCGCTDIRACAGGCEWIKPGLCSVCYDARMDTLADAVLDWLVEASIDAGDIGTYLAGWPAGVHRERTVVRGKFADFEVCVVDHIGVKVLLASRDAGIVVAPHYDPLEVMPLFKEAA